MYIAPKHSAAKKRHPLRNRIVGAAIAASATVGTSVVLSPPAQAASVWDAVAACESGGNWRINSHNGYYGGLQFSMATWRGFGGAGYAPSAHLASKAAQIAIARRVLAVQGPGAWPVCGRRAHLTRANGGATTAFTVSRARPRAAIVRVKLPIDGRWGPQTIRALHRWIGGRTVLALQRKVGARADGVWGPRTLRAVQIRIGTRPDGARHWSPATVRALQRYLNRVL